MQVYDPHKSTFTQWVEVSKGDMPMWVDCKKTSGYGDYCNIYYEGDDVVGKAVISQGKISYYKYIKDGVGDEYECDCEKPEVEIKGFSQEGLITIKKED